MNSPKNPELAFLIEALHLSPDEVFEYILRQHPVWKLKEAISYVADKTRINVGMMNLRHFTPEIVDAWRYYVMGNEKTPVSGDKAKSIFEFIRERSREYLLIQNGDPYFKIEKIEEWQDVSFHCGEDLFVAALLADKNIQEGYEPRNFQWNYILKSDFSLLNNMIVENKIVENHYHLGGSSPMADISWIYLMNHPFGQEDRFKAFLEDCPESLYLGVNSLNETRQSPLQTLVKAAAYIRLWLFQRCVLQKKCKKEEGKETKQNVIYDIRDILHTAGVLQEDEMTSTIDAFLYDSDFSVFSTKVDYAIKGIQVLSDEKNSYIAGERYFNYCCLKHIYTHPENDDYSRMLYYIYLLIKHHFNLYFVQSNNKTGFQNFRDYNDRKDKLIGGTKYYDMATNLALQGDITENHLEQLEVRIAPYETANEVTNKVIGTDAKAYYRSSRISGYERITPRKPEDNSLRYSDGTDKYFYVLHFIKQKDFNWYSKKEDYEYAPMCREHAKREEYRRQAEILMDMRDRNEEVCKRIFGIDAANNEVNFRPENFGTVFRYLASSRTNQDVPWIRKMPDLRKTYHTGEDYYEVIGGLRAIDEAVMFLELSQGDRIGHGVALGIDVDKWYERHSVVALPLQNKLDNIAWMLHKIREWGLTVSTAYYEKLMTEFEGLYGDLYQDSCPGLVPYIEAWKLRGDAPECYSSPRPDEAWLNPTTRWERYCIRDKEKYKVFVEITKRLSQKDQSPAAYTIYHRYHYDTDLKRRASEIVKHVFNQDEYTLERIRLVKQIQLHMRTLVANKGIGVESCPSSNFLISNLDEFKEVPTFNMFPIREDEADHVRINVCVNTDDQGVFYTNLVKEYTMLAGTLRKFKTEDNKRKYSDNEILRWIKQLMYNSKQLCFRTGDVENYGIRSDNNLFEDYKEKPLDDRYVLPNTF